MPADVQLLVDLENVQPSPQDVEAWLGKAGQAWVFYGPNQLKRKAAFEQHSPRSTLVPISRSGANSLDFHLVFYLGYLAAKHPKSRFVVLAKDKGYDPPIIHARTLAFSIQRLKALPASLPTSIAATKKATPIEISMVPLPPSKRKTVVPKPTRALKVAESASASSGQPSLKEKAHQATSNELYRKLVAELNRTNRPNSMLALQRYIQTKFGTTSNPEQVQTTINRLLTGKVINLKNNVFTYRP